MGYERPRYPPDIGRGQSHFRLAKIGTVPGLSFGRPTRGKRPRLPEFSGWLMPAIASLAVFMSGPAQTYGVSVFVDPMLQEMGWSRSFISLAYSVGTLVSAGALLVVGRQIDRSGTDRQTSSPGYICDECWR